MRSVASRPLVIVLSALVLSIAAASALAQTEPLVGTWKLNVAKSKYSPGPPSASELVTYEATPGGVKYTVKGAQADGSPINFTGSLIHDGKDYPATGTADYDAVSTSRIDANTTESSRKKGGKVTQVTTRAVSKDGKTLTLTTKGTTAAGVTIFNVAVYERQS